MEEFIVQPANGFTNWGGSHDTPKGNYDGLGTIVLQGLLKAPTGTIATNTVIARLPVPFGFDPLKTLIFHCPTHGGNSVRIDVEKGGDLVFKAGTINTWVSLSGIVYNTGVKG
jgi:hypothetical protein